MGADLGFQNPCVSKVNRRNIYLYSTNKLRNVTIGTPTCYSWDYNDEGPEQARFLFNKYSEYAPKTVNRVKNINSSSAEFLFCLIGFEFLKRNLCCKQPSSVHCIHLLLKKSADRIMLNYTLLDIHENYRSAAAAAG